MKARLAFLKGVRKVEAPTQTRGTRLRWTRQRLHTRDETIAYVDLGSPVGPPIVLLHGYMGSLLTWRHLLEPLARHARVVAIDWPGWGRSQRDVSLRLDLEADLERLERILAALGIDRFSLFGHDYGGYLGLAYCLRAPERVVRLAVLNSRAHRSFRASWWAALYLGRVFARNPWISALLSWLPFTRFHRWILRRERRLGVLDDETLAEYVGWMSGEPGGARFYLHYLSEYRVQTRRELARRLHEIACPTAVIWGARDKFLPVRIPFELERAIPGAVLTLLEDAGHFVTEERPAEVLAALTALLGRSGTKAEGRPPASTLRTSRSLHVD